MVYFTVAFGDICDGMPLSKEVEMGIFTKIFRALLKLLRIRKGCREEQVVPLVEQELSTPSPGETGVVDFPTVISDEDRRALVVMGVVFSEEAKTFAYEDLRDEANAPFLLKVSLPFGWTKCRIGDTSYWWGIFDSKGRKRAEMFYKAASYDRRTQVNVFGRYGVVGNSLGKDRYSHSVRDGVTGKVVFVSAAYFLPSSGETPIVIVGSSNRQEVDRLAKASVRECEAWLDTNFSKWRDKAAYWDD